MPEQPRQPCPYCNWTFPDPRRLALHLQLDHQWTYGCACGEWLVDPRDCDHNSGNSFEITYRRALTEHIAAVGDFTEHLAKAALLAAAREKRGHA